MSLLILAKILSVIGVAICSPMKQFDDSQTIEDSSTNQHVYLEVDETGQCIYVKSEEGTYVVNSAGTPQVCGLYVIAEPDRKVEFEFQSFDVSCVKGGLISVIDGWELNGQFFPNALDRSSRKLFTEYCGSTKKPRKVFRSSQNVALIEYRIPTKGQGFTVTVKFVDNPKPCNVVLQEPKGTYTLRNYNRKGNCSVSVIFPLQVQFLAVSVGVQSSWPMQVPDSETGLLRKCKKFGMRDYLEVRGGDGLDPLQMDVATDFCGLESRPKSRSVTVACGNTALRLVSSGRFENSVTFNFDLPMDLNDVDIVCPSFAAAMESF